MTTTPGSRALTALMTGAATTAYYAVPDVARTRAARGWLKAACVAAAFAVPASLEREMWQDARATWQDRAVAPAPGSDVDTDTDATDADTDATDADGKPTTVAEWWRAASPRGKSATVAIALGLTVASTALTVAGERWVFRRGETRAAAGVRFAHTRQGLVLGALSAALQLIPDSSERR